MMRAVVSGVRSSNNCSTRLLVNGLLFESIPLTLITRLRFVLGANTAVNFFFGLTVTPNFSG